MVSVEGVLKQGVQARPYCPRADPLSSPANPSHKNRVSSGKISIDFNENEQIKDEKQDTIISSCVS